MSLSSLTSGLQKIGSYATQAWDFAQAGIQGYQQAQQFAASLGIGGRPSGGGPAQAPPPAPGAPSEPAQPAPAAFASPAAFAPPPGYAPAYDAGAAAQPQVPALPAAGGDQLAALLQALQQRQIPPLPGAAPQSAFAAAAPAPVAAPAPAPAPQQPNALALLGTILSNPQLQQALQAGVARSVQLPVPSAAAPGHARSVPIPLNAVLSAVLSLAGHSMTELAEAGEENSDDAPLYVLGDDGYMLVDPRDADQRDALIAYLFRLNAAARASGWYPQFDGDGARGSSY